MIIEVHSVSFIFRLLILFIDLLMSSSYEGRKACGLRVVSDPQPVTVTKLSVDLGHCSLCFSDWPLGERKRRRNYEHPGFCVTFPFQPGKINQKNPNKYLTFYTSKILASPRLWCPSSWSLSNTQDVQLGHFQTPITDHPNACPNQKRRHIMQRQGWYDNSTYDGTTYTNSRKKSKTCSKALRALQNVSQEAHKRSSS